MSLRSISRRKLIAFFLSGLVAGTIFDLWNRMMSSNSPLAEMRRLIKSSEEFIAKTPEEQAANQGALLLAQKEQLSRLADLAFRHPDFFDRSGMDFAELYKRQAMVEMSLAPARGSYQQAEDLLRRAVRDLDGMLQNDRLLPSEYKSREAEVYEQLGNLKMQWVADQARTGNPAPPEYLRSAINYFLMAIEFSRLADKNTIVEGRSLSRLASAHLDLGERDKASHYALRGAAIMKMLPVKGKEASPKEIIEVINTCSTLNQVFRKLGNDAASKEMWDKVFSLDPRE